MVQLGELAKTVFEHTTITKKLISDMPKEFEYNWTVGLMVLMNEEFTKLPEHYSKILDELVVNGTSNKIVEIEIKTTIKEHY